MVGARWRIGAWDRDEEWVPAAAGMTVIGEVG
jgi:hypothetical protein